MSAEIVNLRQARKRMARSQKEREAEENRRRHGRSKAERRLESSERGKMEQTLEGARRDRQGVADRDTEN
jgi:hypothetical protein